MTDEELKKIKSDEFTSGFIWGVIASAIGIFVLLALSIPWGILAPR